MSSSFVRIFSDNKDFLGVFSQDCLSNLKISEDKFFVVNLDFENEPGTHWIGIKVKNKIIEIYDSLGMNSLGWFRKPYFLLKFLFRFRNTHKLYITPHLQHSSSYLCGFYVLYFLNSNVCLKSNLLHFTQSKIHNDVIIKNLFV